MFVERQTYFVIGIGQGGNNLVQTLCDCNREQGNLIIHVQCPGCLKGPVAKCPENVAISFCSPQFPLLDTFNDLVSNFYFSLIFFAENSNEGCVDCIASMSVLKPVPTPSQLTDRQYNVTCMPMPILTSDVACDDEQMIAILIYLGMMCRTSWVNHKK